jgi:hypothetical protein
MSRINKRAKRVLLGIDAYEKAKTSAALMFLRALGTTNAKRMMRSNHPISPKSQYFHLFLMQISP